MSKINIKDVIKPTVTLLIICIIAALALSFSNLATADKIKAGEIQTLKNAMQQVLPADDYSEKVMGESNDETAMYTATSAGSVCGYAMLCTKTGYGGKVKVMVGIDMTGTVKKIAIVSADDETPGLGQNVKTDEFLKRFNDITDANKVDAWTGATISSTAVKSAVNQALEYYNKYKE